jgi:hypothetical protein
MNDPLDDDQRSSEDDVSSESVEEIAIMKALAEAEEDIRLGRVSTQEEVKQRSLQWRFRR